VHNPAAARMVQEHAPRSRVLEIPLLFAPPHLPPESEVLRFRHGMGLPPHVFVFGVFGYLRESKRVLAVLRAFGEVRRTLPDTALVIAGEFSSQDLARAAKPLLGEPGVIRLGHMRERDFWIAASAIDACINLRDPAAGETSAVSVSMMGIGKLVMVTEGEETSRFPETACFRIARGVAEKRSLIEHSMVAASVPQTSREIGRRGAGHVHLHHSLDRVADEYWKVLCDYGG
jgi:glycosyltransferase involved in cell wall biosynthesis